jgi:hypothetical protein
MRRLREIIRRVPAHPPRFLHRHSQYGYTEDPSRAMHTEPEAISVDAEQDLQRKADMIRRATQLAGSEALFRATTAASSPSGQPRAAFCSRRRANRSES